MTMRMRCLLGAELAFFLACVLGQGVDCSKTLTTSYANPVVGSGWTAKLIVNGLNDPRSLHFDSSGKLLVVEQGSGIRRLTFADGGGTCLEMTEMTDVVQQPNLTHSVEFSGDGKTLFASSADEVYMWSYDVEKGTVGDDKRTIITNMSNTDHTTRTLLMSRKQPGTLLVSRGSGENVDDLAKDVTSGHSQIRAFDVNNLPEAPYDYPSQGKMLGWGLRNSVGVAEHPVTGGIFSVENSVDELDRDGTDIHQDNPGEELNFHGFLNGSTEDQGGNYGYPDCFAIWSTDIPDLGSMNTGSQFSPNPTDDLNDATCGSDYVSPRLTWQAHTAPLDMAFTPDGNTAYVSFHGSWNRDNPTGYKLSSVSFAEGQPVDSPTSNTSTVDVLSNADNSNCPDACFRPVGLAIDAQGRLYMSSDTTGEIYVLVKSEMSATGTDAPSGTGTLVAPTNTDSAGRYVTAPGIKDTEGRSLMLVTILGCIVAGFGFGL